MPAQQVVGGGSQGIHIALGVRFAHPVLLGGRVVQRHRPRPGGGIAGGVIHLGDAKVHQDGLPLWGGGGAGDADVGRFQVTVDDGRFLGVQVAQRLAHLDDPAQGFFVGQGGAGPLQHHFQVFAFDIIHHQVLPLPGDDEIIAHPRQVGVAQLEEQAGFELELACEGGVPRGRPGFEVFLQSHCAVQVEVPGQINCAKTTLSEQALDAVAVVQGLTRLKRHAEIILQ